MLNEFWHEYVLPVLVFTMAAVVAAVLAEATLWLIKLLRRLQAQRLIREAVERAKVGKK